jgi:hypothetical protein
VRKSIAALSTAGNGLTNWFGQREPFEHGFCLESFPLPSEDLGKPGCIETEEISGTPPKLSGLTRLAHAAANDAINRAHTPDQLDCLAEEMWGIHVEGAISEDDVTFLSSCIDRRRPMSRRTGSGQGAPSTD